MKSWQALTCTLNDWHIKKFLARWRSISKSRISQYLNPSTHFHTTRFLTESHPQSKSWRAQQTSPRSSTLPPRTLSSCSPHNATWDPRTCKFTWNPTSGRLVLMESTSLTSPRLGTVPHYLLLPERSERVQSFSLTWA